MRQKKNRKKKKNRKIRILTGVVLGVGLAGALFFNVFKIRNIQVAGNTRYTKDEIKEMVADDKWMKNTVLLTTFHSKVDMSDIPFMNSVEFTFVSYDTICIQVNEKKVVGYVEYEGQKVYFDKNGIVLECVDEEQETPAEGEPSDGTASDGTSADGSLTSESLASESVSSDGTASESSTSDGALSADTIKSARVTTTDFQPTLSDVPLVTGLTFDYVTVNKQLPVEKPAVFRTMLALTRMTEKYNITPDSVEFNENSEIILHYYADSAWTRYGVRRKDDARSSNPAEPFRSFRRTPYGGLQGRRQQLCLLERCIRGKESRQKNAIILNFL